MFLGYGVFSSFFFLSQFSLYAVIAFFALGCLLDRVRFGVLGQFSAKALTSRFPLRGWLLVLLPLLIALLFFLLIGRSSEVLAPVGGLITSGPAYKWLTFVYFIGALFIVFLSLAGAGRLSSSSVEFFAAATLLVQV
jgi:hypothetical protein